MPSITFSSRRIEKKDGHRFALVGDLKIKDQVREVVLDGSFEGLAKTHGEVRGLALAPRR